MTGSVTNWWWVRHGPTHEKAFVGWRDVPADLSDTAQITRLNTYLPDDAVVVSSDLLRARATADAIEHAREHARTRLPDAPQIKEFNFGDWDGLHFDVVAERDPVLGRAFWENPGDIAPPNGESWNQVAARTAKFVNDMNMKHGGRNIIAVAHIGVIMTQIQRAGKLAAYAALGHKIDNLSVTRLTHTNGAWAIEEINHLP